MSIYLLDCSSLIFLLLFHMELQLSSIWGLRFLHWGSSVLSRLAMSQQLGTQAHNKCLAFGGDALTSPLITGYIKCLLT